MVLIQPDELVSCSAGLTKRAGSVVHCLQNTPGEDSDSDTHIFPKRSSGETLLPLGHAYSTLSLLISVS